MRTVTLGIDVGGTYTDGLIVDPQGQILDVQKVPTQRSISESLDLLAQCFSPALRKQITSIHIGTTHGLNALLQGTPLLKVGVIRLMGHKPDLLPCALGWPPYLKNAVFAGEVTVNGGMECDGRPITELNPQEILQAAETLIAKGAEAIGVVGSFSPLYGGQEEEAVALLKQKFTIPIGKSAPFGGLGIIERENAAILNLSLYKSLGNAFKECEQIFKDNLISASVYWVHDLGGLLTTQEVIQHPIRTLASGPVNALMGGARLAGYKNCVVLDVGGTSTDGGIIEKGFIRFRHEPLQIAGVDIGCIRSDVRAINLGGGTIVNPKTDLSLQDQSVGSKIWDDSRPLTLTDAALLEGVLDIEDFEVHYLSKEISSKALKEACQKISLFFELLDPRKMYPRVIVGGGACLFKNLLKDVFIPEKANVANAYGAAMAQKGYFFEKIIDLTHKEKALEDVKAEAEEKARSVGFVNPQVIHMNLIPYHYLPGARAHVLIQMVGE